MITGRQGEYGWKSLLTNFIRSRDIFTVIEESEELENGSSIFRIWIVAGGVAGGLGAGKAGVFTCLIHRRPTRGKRAVRIASVCCRRVKGSGTSTLCSAAAGSITTSALAATGRGKRRKKSNDFMYPLLIHFVELRGLRTLIQFAKHANGRCYDGRGNHNVGLPSLSPT